MLEVGTSSPGRKSLMSTKSSGMARERDHAPMTSAIAGRACRPRSIHKGRKTRGAEMTGLSALGTKSGDGGTISAGATMMIGH